MAVEKLPKLYRTAQRWQAYCPEHSWRGLERRKAADAKNDDRRHYEREHSA